MAFDGGALDGAMPDGVVLDLGALEWIALYGASFDRVAFARLK